MLINRFDEISNSRDLWSGIGEDRVGGCIVRRIHYDALPAWAPCMRGHVHEKRPTRGVSTSYIYIYTYIWITHRSWPGRDVRPRSEWFTVILTYRSSVLFRLERWTWRKIQFSLIIRTCNDKIVLIREGIMETRARGWTRLYFFSVIFVK